ncbi:MAG: 3-deoxy-manno-octulosonate cytidylyltransferase [Armatimonadota bacterium]
MTDTGHIRALGVIPARLAATRLPNKPLLDINGKPMVQWVWERARQSERLNDVIIATPDSEIIQTCEGFGAIAVLTDPDHPTGTDRVAEAAALYDHDVVVNIQGDEPLIEPAALDALVEGLLSSESARMASLMFEMGNNEDPNDPNLVKVVTDSEAHAIYFSRCPIPYPRSGNPAHFAHIGVYAWRRDALFEFPKLARGVLEQAESLEQLRALEAGWKIKMVSTHYRPIGVDTPEDLDKARRVLAGI